MPRLKIDLSAVSAARQKIAGLTDQINAQTRALADAKAELALAQSRRDSSRIAELAKTVAAQQAARDKLSQNRAKLTEQAQALANALARQRDPGLMMTALDGGVPVAFLPVRLETRYLANPQRLAIRVYPDVIHTMRATGGLTASERERGQAYWQARFERREQDGENAADQAEARAAAIWRDMVTVSGAPRATWIVRTLAPSNLAQMGTPGTTPAFPSDIADITSGARATVATALPDRWCAVGQYQGTTVFKVWSSALPDTLAMAPVLDPNTPMPEDEGLYGGDRAWLVDFQAAVQAGMGIVVNLADLKQGYGFAKGLTRLTVFGVDWTLDADQSAGVMGGLLAAHQAASGMAFVALGDPTNNTGRAVSGYSSGGDAPPPPSVGQTAAPGQYAAAERLCNAFGLDASAIDGPNVPNAALDEGGIAMHMINALWRATFGRYMSTMFNPAFFDESSDQPDSYVSRTAVSATRSFAVQYLRPSGALPTFRIGRQPYGVLPVVAASYQPDGAIDGGILKVLGMLRPRWNLASTHVPNMVDGSIETATALLQTGPWSRVMRARGVDNRHISFGPTVYPPGSNNEMMAANQQNIKQRWTADLLKLFNIIKPYQDAEIDGLLVSADPVAMPGVPWVQADPKQPRQEIPPEQALSVDAQGRNYIAAIRDAMALPKGQAKLALNAHESGKSLLEMLLAFSAEEEIDQAAFWLVADTDHATDGKPYGRTVVSNAPVTAINIEPKLTTPLYREIATPREVALLRLPTVTGDDTIEEFIVRKVAAAPIAPAKSYAVGAGKHFFESPVGPAAALPLYLVDVARLRQSLTYLSGLRAGPLDIAFKTTLDAYSYRLDAWYTALATRRLENVRAARPTGLYVGGYGWVEGLPPPPPANRPATASLGYVHAPSLGQAQAAAILRSGHLANHENAAGSFNIDLSSERARRAIQILQGVGRGQSLAELLGYRLERSLRDALLGYLVLALRLAFPAKSTDDAAPAQAAEYIGARDVVDGVKLLDSYKAGGAAAVINAAVAVFGPISPAISAAALDPSLLDLAQTWDAVSDTLVAEGVYQVAQGNLERAGAALAVLDQQNRPIEPQIARTPRIGVSYAQRLMVVCGAAAMSQAWQAASAKDDRARAEPRLTAWLATMLGEPDRYSFEAKVMRGNTVENTVLRVTPADLGWSPLTLVLASRAVSGAGQARHSALRARIAQTLAAQVTSPDAGTQLIIDAQSSQAGKLGLAAFEALAGTLGQVASSSRPLNRRDLIIPIDAIDAAEGAQAAALGEYVGCDLADIEMRASVSTAALKRYIDALSAAPTDAAALALLQDGWLYGIVAGTPPTAPDAAGEPVAAGSADEAIQTRRSQALAQAQSQYAAAAALAPEAPGNATLAAGARVQNAITRIKSVYGKDFPVLPQFNLGGYAASVNDSLAARDSMTANDAGVLAGWLPKLSRVRAGAERLGAAMTAHEALLGARALSDWQVVQLPYVAQDCWAALPQRWANPGADPDTPRRAAPALSWVAHMPDGIPALAADTPLAGILVDEWQEFVPSAWQTTAISFHYDAPGSRPPQAVLLAVPPRAGMENWTFEDLQNTIGEAFELAKLRAVRPQDLSDGLGLMLPANYLPENPTNDTPSVRLTELIRQSATLYGGVGLALGKQ